MNAYNVECTHILVTKVLKIKGMMNTKFRMVISVDMDRRWGKGRRRNTQVETNVLFFVWVVAS